MSERAEPTPDAEIEQVVAQLAEAVKCKPEHNDDLYIKADELLLRIYGTPIVPLVYGRIRRYQEMGGDDGKCWASQQRIANDLMISRKSAQRAVTILRRDGFIQEIGRDMTTGVVSYVTTDKLERLYERLWQAVEAKTEGPT